MFLAPGAQAQSNACDVLKGTLAARIEATGVRGYSLETVPGATPVPSGAKVIGTCEGGASKVLYRRWGAAQASSADAAVAKPASAAQAAVVLEKPIQRAPLAEPDRAVRPAAVPTVVSTAASASGLVPASTPSPTPRPVSRSNDAASAAPISSRASESPLLARVSEVEPVRGVAAVAQPTPVQVEPPVQASVQPPVQPEASIVAKASLTQRVSDFMAGKWHWLWALLLLPAAAWAWAWHAYRSAYDEAGLPRGPKL